MGDEHLYTIPATESDEFIKSSVENLVPNPSESEVEYECDVPAYKDFTTFSNILFDVDYDFSSSDDQSFYDEDIPKEIYSNPLFDEEIISMKIDPHHFNAKSDFIGSLLNRDSSINSSSSKIDSLFDENLFIKRLLYDNSSPRPPEEFISENSDTAFESFSQFPIPVEDSDSPMEEIDLSFTLADPMPSGIKEDDYDSERDILILEELFSNDSLSLPENESFHFDIPSSSRPPAKPPDGNTGILNVKMMGDIYENKTHAEGFCPPVFVSSASFRESFVSYNSDADIESFSPSPIPVEDSNSFMEEIDLFLKPDDPMPSGIEEDDDDSKRDVLILEELLDNYSLSLPVIESYHFDIPSFSIPPAKPPDGNT
nr:hypothetical protein [Tanacetum cinerariifolium]